MYRAFAAGIFGLYTLASWNGWQMGSAKRDVIPADIRQQPGGYRSYHSYTFWRGGK
jgi:hypothetical protein